MRLLKKNGPATPPAPQGFVLIAVLVVVVLLTLAAYQYGEFMLSEYRAASSFTRAAQARAFAESGVHYAAAFLSNAEPITDTDRLSRYPFENSTFKDHPVDASDLPGNQGRFSIVVPDTSNQSSTGAQSFRYGMLDESSKINLNALMKLDASGKVAHDMLLTLPNMTEEIANSILDWLDDDDDTRQSGAEDDYYEALIPSYRAKNGPLESLEELLQVKGVTPQLLLGNDRNRNGLLDPAEDDGSGILDRGWSEYLTIYSHDKNADSQGNQRTYINDSDYAALMDKLDKLTESREDLQKSPGWVVLVDYLLAYRVYGPAQGQGSSSGSGSTTSSGGGSQGTSKTNSPSGSTSGGGQASGSGASGGQLTRDQINPSGRQLRSIASLFELVNSSVSIPGRDARTPPKVYPSPLNDPTQLRELLPLLLDCCTTTKELDQPGKININTAPQAVLAALPGITETDVQSILGVRPSLSSTETPDQIFQTLAWLVTEANLPPSKVQTLERYITTQTHVYRGQVIGYFDGGGPSVRLEFVIDANPGAPRILYLRDLTELGKGFDLGTLNANTTGASP